MLTAHKLFEDCFWQNLLMFYDEIDLSIRMRIIYNGGYRYTIRSKFGGKFLTFLTKLVFKGKASVCFTIEENLLLI